MINFVHIEWLYALPISLLIVPVLIFTTRLNFNNERIQIQKLFQRVLYFPAIHLLQDNPSTKPTTVNTHKLRTFLHIVIIISSLHLALSQPYKTGEKLPDPPSYRDIVFIVDTSVSLVLRDYIIAGQRTDRMTMLKTVLRHFIEQLKGNRLSLVVFSEAAYTYVPLTTDYSLLNYQLDRLEPAILTGRTSDVSRALLYTLHSHNQSQPARNKQDNTPTNDKPVFVLISDVNRPNRDIDPKTVASLFSREGLRLHTIALGAATQAGNENAVTGLVYQPANFKLLQGIADAGQGKFFWANSSQSLQSALLTIQQAEQKKIEVEPVYIRYTLYYWPLLFALLFIFLSNILPLFSQLALPKWLQIKSSGHG